MNIVCATDDNFVQHCSIMPGVTIGEGVVIGAGSLVTKDVPAWTVAMGRPAKVIRILKNPNE